MTEARLAASKREGTGKGVARKLRQAGRVPAVLYGRDMEPVHLSVDAHDAELLFRSISVENTVIDLEVEGEKAPYPALVREVQTHPWKESLLHIDFLRIQKGVAVDVEVPIHLLGTPEGVRTHGGTLEQVIHELEVRCIPSKIPEAIEVDVSGLDVGDALHVSDLVVEEGVEILTDPDQTICAIAAPRVAEEEAAAEEELEGVEAPPTPEAAGEEGSAGDEG